MAALKEAVSDDEYLSEAMKNGNGSVRLKGFKVRLSNAILPLYSTDDVHRHHALYLCTLAQGFS